MKSGIRKKMLEQREAHHSVHGHAHCLQITHRLCTLSDYLSAKCILLYSSKGSEVHTQSMIQTALLAGKKVVLPVTLKESHTLALYELKDYSELVVGAFGILEPPKLAERKVLPEKIDLAVIPGVSFDRSGHRLGYGMGYYDALLAKMKCKKIALAYGMQILEEIPSEPHDICMDMIVTEEEIVQCIATIAVLASGRGSDFQSLIDAAKTGKMSVKIVALITNNPQAPAIERAKKNSIDVFVVDVDAGEERDRKIKETLDKLAPNLVVLAGYMKIIRSKELLLGYKGRMINIHPSRLPKYPGAHAQKDAFDAGEKISGYTIHYVDDTLDGGEIIYQEKVNISECTTWEEASAKILEREHVGLPMIVDKLVRQIATK